MESTSAPTHTQIVTPGTTDTSHHRLRIAATVCWKLFERCTKVSTPHLGRNYGKFKVWCGNLGVRQGGHASLDWRLKDDDIMENEVFSMLTDLEDDLQQVLELLSGTRPPYEQEEPGSETSSLNDPPLPGELEVRLDAISATITALYQMSFLVRNQGTRRLASAKAQNYQPRDPEEAALLESFVSFDRQHIDDLFRDLRRPRSVDDQPMATRSDLRSDGDAQDRTIKARCLAASTARRRQLAYWKMHSSKLKSVAMIPDTADLDQNATIYSGTEASGVFRRIERDFDVVEVQTLTSVASTVRDIDGHETDFPGPPERSSDDDPFECPYCYVLCQPEESGRRRWKKHILEDLRPYICTYSDCQDGLQLYGNRKEWVAHEDAAHRSSSVTSDVSKKPLATDDREQCPICLLDVAELPSRTALKKHLASHLERFSLDCLPLDTSSWGDQNIHDDGSESSDEDQDLRLGHHEHNAHNEQQETITESFEAQTEEDYRVEEVVLSEKVMREIELGQLLTPAESELLRESYKRSEGGTQEETQGTELSTSEKIIRGKFDAEREQVIEDYQRRSGEAREAISPHEAESKVNHESYNSGPEDDLRNKIDAQRHQIVEGSERRERERRERELKKQEDRTVAEPAERREEELLVKNEPEKADDAQDKLDDVMRKRLAEFGFTQSQVDEMTTDEQESNQQPASTRPKITYRIVGGSTKPHAPVCFKIHTDHMAIETLKYYDLPWKYDKSDPSYIVILRKMDEHELNILFDYTKRLREGRLILNESGDKIIEQRTKTSVLPRKD